MIPKEANTSDCMICDGMKDAWTSLSGSYGSYPVAYFDISSTIKGPFNLYLRGTNNGPAEHGGYYMIPKEASDLNYSSELMYPDGAGGMSANHICRLVVLPELDRNPHYGPLYYGLALTTSTTYDNHGGR